MTTRRQATLFLPSPWREPIEALRQRFNPAQRALIDAHVTLIREDEVADWDALSARIRPIELALAFGAPVRDGNLVTLPVVDATEFDALRATLLDRPRLHRPHITLIHPRNGACTDADFAELARRIAPFTAVFRRVSLIEQRDGGPWRDTR